MSTSVKVTEISIEGSTRKRRTIPILSVRVEETLLIRDLVTTQKVSVQMTVTLTPVIAPGRHFDFSWSVLL